MKVFIVLEEVKEDKDEVRNVFSTLEKAREYIAKERQEANVFLWIDERVVDNG